MSKPLFKTSEYVAHWSGEYPNLCSGRWSLFRNGVDVSGVIPPEKQTAPMDTFITCYDAMAAEGLSDGPAWYQDGLELEEWVKKNEWAYRICDNPVELRSLYESLRDEDWRHGSCGGCV